MAFCDNELGDGGPHSHAIGALADAGRAEEARAQLADLRRRPEEIPEEVFPGLTGAWMALSLFRIDETSVAAGTAQASEPFPELWPHFYTAVVAPMSMTVGLCRLATGEFDAAIESLRRSRQHCRDVGFVGLVPLASSLLIEALAARDRGDDRVRATELLAELRDTAAAIGAPRLVERAAEALTGT